MSFIEKIKDPYNLQILILKNLHRIIIGFAIALIIFGAYAPFNMFKAIDAELPKNLYPDLSYLHCTDSNRFQYKGGHTLYAHNDTHYQTIVCVKHAINYKKWSVIEQYPKIVDVNRNGCFDMQGLEYRIGSIIKEKVHKNRTINLECTENSKWMVKV